MQEIRAGLLAAAEVVVEVGVVEAGDLRGVHAEQAYAYGTHRAIGEEAEGVSVGHVGDHAGLLERDVAHGGKRRCEGWASDDGQEGGQRSRQRQHCERYWCQ